MVFFLDLQIQCCKFNCVGEGLGAEAKELRHYYQNLPSQEQRKQFLIDCFDPEDR
jgi:hypothetical protein